MFVLGEKVVEYSERGLEVEIYNIFGTGFRLGKSSVLHQIESKANVGDLLLKRLQLKRNNG